MSGLDLEKGLSEFLEKAKASFLADPGYAEKIAQQAEALRVRREPENEVD